MKKLAKDILKAWADQRRFQILLSEEKPQKTSGELQKNSKTKRVTRETSKASNTEGIFALPDRNPYLDSNLEEIKFSSQELMEFTKFERNIRDNVYSKIESTGIEQRD